MSATPWRPFASRRALGAWRFGDGRHSIKEASHASVRVCRHNDCGWAAGGGGTVVTDGISMMNNPSPIQPLRFPLYWPEPSRLELILRCIPIFGWIAAGVLERARLDPIADKLFLQFEARIEQSPEYWSDKLRKRISRALIDSCVKACCWPHSHFIPQDSFGVMIKSRTGNGCEWDAQFRIEKALGIVLTGKEWQKIADLTLDEVVDVLAMRSEAGGLRG
ncbi:hypothetical protein I41_37680 [Lacipirellula limnantheis]|uniref:Uncharacterized protein n=1 Tax=Lacipirellula limnantheis TaxID=2528024 RepID=A0A517U1R6_9BACT|nr:hypothetical protein I41_37680 [Lacipirellula limnantheis]